MVSRVAFPGDCRHSPVPHSSEDGDPTATKGVSASYTLTAMSCPNQSKGERPSPRGDMEEEEEEERTLALPAE